MENKTEKSYEFVRNILKSIGLPLRISGCCDNEIVEYAIRNKQNTKHVVLNHDGSIIFRTYPLKTKVSNGEIYRTLSMRYGKIIYNNYVSSAENYLEDIVNVYKFILQNRKYITNKRNRE